MPVLNPISPEALKKVLEEAGFRVIDESEYNWVLARDAKDEPFLLPKRGRRVAVDVMSRAHSKAREHKFSNDLLRAVRDGLDGGEEDEESP